MPLKVYPDANSYDDDYDLVMNPQSPRVLPAAKITFKDNILIPDPFWPDIGEGGELYISIEKGSPINTVARIKEINGNRIILNTNKKWDLTKIDVPEGKIKYYVPQFRCKYVSAVMREQSHMLTDDIIRVLDIRKNQSILVVGCGFGWEIEKLIDDGYQIIGTEISPWIHENKYTDESKEINAALLAGGFNPEKGEGKKIREKMLALPRCKCPDSILNLDIMNIETHGQIKDHMNLPIGEKIDWAFTIGVIVTLNDKEAIKLNDSMLNIAKNVAHYITCLPDVSDKWNQKTEEDWKSFLDPSVIIPHGDPIRGLRKI